MNIPFEPGKGAGGFDRSRPVSFVPVARDPEEADGHPLGFFRGFLFAIPICCFLWALPFLLYRLVFQ
jgi:hypothetical protein